MKTRISITLGLISLFLWPGWLPAQVTAFTYQGQLNDGTIPANGSYDLTFSLWNAASGPAQVGGPLTNSATAVSNGLFTITLDFGANFPGAARWLELAVRTNGGGAFATLSPRQQLTPTPYAITASTASNLLGALPAGQLSGELPSAQLSGTYSSAVTLDNAANSFTGNGSGLTSVNAATVGGLTSASFWQTSGNAGSSPGANFLGTTDNQPLELRVNGARALRLVACANTVSTSNLVNVIAGSPNNYVAPFVIGATLAGGGALKLAGLAATNSINDNFGTLSGGAGNSIVAGGSAGTLAGGYQNSVAGAKATVSGGELNAASGEYATVGGGVLNGSSGVASTLSGGGQNRVGGTYSVVSGGRQNINDSGNYSVVGGGQQNVIIASDYQTIAGGYNNLAGATGATIGGGAANISGGDYATVPGGNQNSAAGSYSFAAGRQAKVYHQSTFVWADSAGGSGEDFTSTGLNQFLIRAGGGVGIGTNNPAQALHVIGNILASGTVTGSSDRNVKRDFAPVNSREVLDKVTALPISTWSYIGDDGVRHLGPMAQDFYAAFSVGMNDKTISMVDADGVALAAIQGLNQKLEQKEIEITDLKQRLEKLERLMNGKQGGAK